MEKVRAAVIGAGYFGRFHAEKYARLKDASIVAVADRLDARAAELARAYKTEAVADYRDLFGKVDAVSVVVPTPAHFEVAMAFLDHGVDVLLEKPMTESVSQADELIARAESAGRILQIGHLQRFSSAIMALDGVINRPVFIECNRIAPFKPRGAEVNVILDLMIHDIDLIQAIAGSPVAQVDAVGTPVLTGEADIANVRLHFQSGCSANVTASRVSLKNERKMRIFQPDAYFSVDFVARKLAILRKGEGEMFPGVPRIVREERSFEDGDELEREIAAFVHAVKTRTPPPVSGRDGRRALETAIMITDSLSAHAERVAANQSTQDQGNENDGPEATPRVGTHTLDATDLACPLPVLRANKKMRALAPGEILEVLATDRGAVSDFQVYCQRTGYELLSSDDKGGILHFRIRKTG